MIGDSDIVAAETDNIGDHDPDLERIFKAAVKDQVSLCDWDAILANTLMENDPPELVDDRTIAEKALDTIHLPDNIPPEKIDKVKRQQRCFRIVRSFLEAEDKETVIAELMKNWGLTNMGARLIIADGMKDDRLPADLAAQRNAVCFVKRHQIFDDGRKARDEILKQIIQAQGEERWIEEEFVEDHSEKGGDKIKHISKNRALRELHSAMQDSHRKESDALHMYMEKPASKTDHGGVIKHQLDASQEFRDMFERIRQLEIAKIKETEDEK